MKSSVLIALLGASSAVKLVDSFDEDPTQDFMADAEKHNFFTDQNGKTFDLAQHGKIVDQSYVQQADNFDEGFENIDIIPGEHKKPNYFVAQSGKTFDLSSGHKVNLRNEGYILGDSEDVQIGDWYDKNMPEDAFQEAPPAPVLKKEAGKGAGFSYDRVTGLPILAGMESDAEGQLNYDSMVQLAKDAPKKAATSGFGYDKNGLPNVLGDAIDYDHDFVQFKGEPIGVVLKNRNLLQTSDSWMDAQADFIVEENIKVPHKNVRPEGIWNTVVTI